MEFQLLPSVRITAMAKGQQRSNREAKKPKAEKPKTPVASSFTTSPAKTKPGSTAGNKK
jgi:hypothetical protein